MNKILVFIGVYASTGKKRPLKTDGDTLKDFFLKEKLVIIDGLESPTLNVELENWTKLAQ